VAVEKLLVSIVAGTLVRVVIEPESDAEAEPCVVTAAVFVQLKQYKVVAEARSVLGKVTVPPVAALTAVAVPIPGHAATAVIGATAVGQPRFVVLTVQLASVVLVA
jgi:hypothetical protein